MKVLIIDDHAAMRQTIKSVLNAPGMEFIEGGDGQAAIRLFSAHHPDWVLMDYMLPKMDGLDATREIHHLNPIARILFVTNYDDAHLRAAATEAGACGFVPKERLTELRCFITTPTAAAGNDAAILPKARAI
ncbi:MAG: response regulator transcription factor [Verrucomicrobiota bacterium]